MATQSRAPIEMYNSPTLIAFHESFSVMFLIESVGFWDKVGEA